MKVQLLPSTLETDATASPRQHLTCFVIDDAVAIDAGSLAMAATPLQQERIRDVVLTHAHLDHIAGLPLFVDDLFSTLTKPVTIHCTPSVVEILERDVFNWSVYPRFSELSNASGPVLEYRPFDPGDEFVVQGLTIRSIEVNHRVPTVGLLVSDGKTSVAMSGDTAEMGGFWELVNAETNISAILVECAFPDELEDLARISHHLTPKRLRSELEKSSKDDCPVYIVNIKPMYRETIIRQLADLKLPNVAPLVVGKIYEW